MTMCTCFKCRTKSGKGALPLLLHIVTLARAVLIKSIGPHAEQSRGTSTAPPPTMDIAGSDAYVSQPPEVQHFVDTLAHGPTMPFALLDMHFCNGSGRN